MTSEEKKTIDHIKESPTYRELILLRVFEKQQKEIEELKKYEKYYEEMEEVNKKFIAVDKIKAKIEFIKSLKEKIYYEENVISVLQSLLEKD